MLNERMACLSAPLSKIKFTIIFSIQRFNSMILLGAHVCRAISILSYCCQANEWIEQSAALQCRWPAGRRTDDATGWIDRSRET